MKIGWSVALASAVAVACQAPPPTARESSTPARRVRAAVVSRGPAGDRTVPAQVYARDRATLAGRATASIVALPVREGDEVRKGAVLVRLEDAALTAAVTAARSERDAADAEYRRMDSLLARGAATTREKEAAAARRAGAQAAFDAARDNLSYAVLRAPFAGVVTARRANVGDVIAPGQALVEIEGGGFEIRAAVDAVTASSVQRGQKLLVDVDPVRQPVAASVRALSPAGDATSHRFDLRADLEPAPGLRSGLFARLRLRVDAGESTLLVPRTALLARGGLTGVFVIDRGKTWLRWLAVGATTGDPVEVRAGLREGERVVVSPEGLEDGMAVREES